MRFSRGVMVVCVLSVVVACLAGCSRSAGGKDRREERDPLFRRAMARKNVEDVDGAIELFNRALERKPNLTRAHLELGLLYDMRKQDYVRGIYHYQRYLELRPDAEKKELIEGLIQQAKLSFAVSLPHQPAGAVEEIAMLKREIQLLQSQLDAYQGKTGKAPVPVERSVVRTSVTKPKQAVSPPKPKPVPAKPALQPYVVQSGDTLSSIAAKMYRDPKKWRRIYEANRGSLSSPESVRVGQTLLIPR